MQTQNQENNAMVVALSNLTSGAKLKDVKAELPEEWNSYRTKKALESALTIAIAEDTEVTEPEVTTKESLLASHAKSINELTITKHETTLAIGRLFEQSASMFDNAKQFNKWAIEETGYTKQWINKLRSVARTFDLESFEKYSALSLNTKALLGSLIADSKAPDTKAGKFATEVIAELDTLLEEKGVVSLATLKKLMAPPTPPKIDPVVVQEEKELAKQNAFDKVQQDISDDKEGTDDNFNYGVEGNVTPSPRTLEASENTDFADANREAELDLIISSLSDELKVLKKEKDALLANQKAVETPHLTCGIPNVVLGIKQDATISEAKKAYRVLAKIYPTSKHPEVSKLLIQARDSFK